MILVTKNTTLDEFTSSSTFLIKDPITNILCCAFLKDTISGSAKFIHTCQSINYNGYCKYVRFTYGYNNVVVSDATTLLTLLKEGNFVLQN